MTLIMLSALCRLCIESIVSFHLFFKQFLNLCDLLVQSDAQIFFCSSDEQHMVNSGDEQFFQQQ